MPSEKRSTWGSKRKRGKDYWELRYRVDGKHKSEGFHGTEKEADRRLAELRIKYEGASKAITLSEFYYHFYQPEMEARLASSTIPGYVRNWDNEIEPEFGDKQLTDILPAHIQQWLTPMTRGKAKHAKAVLSAILSRAFALGLIDDNPAQRRFTMPTTEAPGQRSKETMNLAELCQVFAAARGESWEAAFILSAFGGASREEALSPRVDEIKEVAGYAIVPIVRGVQRLQRKVCVLEWTKNDHRKRDLIIPPPYSTRLIELAHEASSRGEAWITDDGSGMPVCPNLIAERFKKWFIGKPYKWVPFGNLRHSYGTVMETLGVDGIMVSKLMGHAQPSTYYKHYFRPSTADKLKAIDDALS